MPWMKNVCEDVLCGGGLGVIKGIFGASFFTASETEEINSLKNLALSVIEKCPKMATEPVICDAIKSGQKYALEAFAKNAPPEAVAAGVVTAAQLVCGKAFKQIFGEVLMGACLNLTPC
jgi:hypothetical protein